MKEIRKYPRTRHVLGSRLQHGDHDLEAVPFETICNKNLIVAEKVDGANSGISFDEKGNLLLQSRGHYLTGGPREKHFALLKQWANTHQEALYCILEDRYVLYGEWLWAKHTVFYDALPHYFMEFDILDTQENVFLDTQRRQSMLVNSPVTFSEPVLSTGPYKNLHRLQLMITESLYTTDFRRANLRGAAERAGVTFEDALSHTDLHEEVEGLYIKWEDDGIVKGRYKYVRSSFTNSILEQEQHWHDRPIINNMLVPGAFEKMLSRMD
jgi:hypothetical protein